MPPENCTPIRSVAFLLVLALAGAASTGCGRQPAAAPAPGPAARPAASATTVRVTGLMLGKRVGGDLQGPATAFAPQDTIVAAVATDAKLATGVPGRLGARWVHRDSGQTMHEDTRSARFSGIGTTEFRIRAPGGWPTGRYRVDILLDGRLVQGRDFEVR